MTSIVEDLLSSSLSYKPRTLYMTPHVRQRRMLSMRSHIWAVTDSMLREAPKVGGGVGGGTVMKMTYEVVRGRGTFSVRLESSPAIASRCSETAKSQRKNERMEWAYTLCIICYDSRIFSSPCPSAGAAQVRYRALHPYHASSLPSSRSSSIAYCHVSIVNRYLGHRMDIPLMASM